MMRIYFGLLLLITTSVFAQNREENIESPVSDSLIPVEETTISVDETSFPQDDMQEDSEIIELEWPEYDQWEVVSLKGKLRMRGLPVSPSVKIFMQRDSIIDISLSAPFVGEVGRALITPDSIWAVNKMSKTYVSEATPKPSVNRDFYNSPQISLNKGALGISELQNLLLGRFFLPGIDIMNSDLNELIDVYYEEEGRYNVVPKEIAEIPGVKYGFVVDTYFNPMILVVIPEGKEDTEIDVFFTPGLKSYDLTGVYQDGNRALEATLELKEPEWKGEAPKEIKIGKGFRKVSFADLMR